MDKLFSYGKHEKIVETKMHNERCKDCKKNINRLLSEVFTEVESNYDLKLPSNLVDYSHTNIYKYIEPIYSALQIYRGFDVFVKATKLPRVDFYIPKKKLIIEFDESQHFTKPREISLSIYPDNTKFGFPIDKWLSLCKQLHKKDNDPPFRDEQRAWYDTLRDFAPMLLGGKIIRLYSFDYIWCSLNPIKNSDIFTFKKLISYRGNN